MRWMTWLLLLCVVTNLDAQTPETLRVMTFNLWHGGDAGKQPLEKTAEVIRLARADIVGLQETEGLAPKGQKRPDNAAKIALLLGWKYFDQGGRTGIISRFPIVGSTEKKWGAKVRLASGREVWMFNAHFAAAPYQPYQLLSIPYHDARFIRTEAEAIKEARAARGDQVARLLADVRGIDGGIALLTGDFNEPSYLDWTAEAAKAGKCPIKVEWPATRAVTDAGFVDAYRAAFGDVLKHRGLTWTPTTAETDPKDRHDRIDFVFVRGAKVRSAQVLGESKDYADIVVEKYPSDHRAVVAEVELGLP